MLTGAKAPQFLEGQIISMTAVAPLGGAGRRRVAGGREAPAK